jgi:hypothetical protein
VKTEFFKGINYTSKGLLYFSFSWLILFSSCTESPKSHEAEIHHPKEQKIDSSSISALSLGMENVRLEWIGTKLLGKHNGTIDLSRGTLLLNDDGIIGGKFTFDMEKIDILDISGHMEDKLYSHLESDDFFDVANHPTSTFEIIEITRWTDKTEIEDKSLAVKDPTHKITGNLTMRGKTLGISFPATISQDKDSIRAVANFNIDRTRWGVSYHSESSLENMAKDKIIKNTVNIHLELDAALN